MDPSNGGLSLFPLLWKRKCPQRAKVACAESTQIFVSCLELQAGLCLHVTAAVKAASHIGTAYVVAATEVCSRFIGTCRELSPPLPLPSPFLSLLFGAFLNGLLRITPFFLWCVPGRLFVAGNTCLFSFLSSPFLSLSLSFFLSFFLSFLSSPPSSLGVRGCFCHSWEPFSSLPLVCPWTLVFPPSPFLSSFSFSLLSLPPPPVGTLEWVATRGSWPYY